MKCVWCEREMEHLDNRIDGNNNPIPGATEDVCWACNYSIERRNGEAMWILPLDTLDVYTVSGWLVCGSKEKPA